MAEPAPQPIALTLTTGSVALAEKEEKETPLEQTAPPEGAPSIPISEDPVTQVKPEDTLEPGATAKRITQETAFRQPARAAIPPAHMFRIVTRCKACNAHRTDDLPARYLAPGSCSQCGGPTIVESDTELP